jgi:hypothetical protein
MRRPILAGILLKRRRALVSGGSLRRIIVFNVVRHNQCFAS